METQPPFNQLKECRHGKVLYNINDMYVGKSFELYGEFSEGEIEVFRQIIKPGDVVLDIGANIGAHTVVLAQLVGPQGAVLAFEPQRIVFQTLCANLALNSISNAFVWNAAVGEEPGTIFVPYLDPASEQNFGGLELGSFTEGQSVDVMCLNDFVLPSCRMIKVDVEGMEIQVLKGITGIISKFRPVLYVENDRPEKSDELVSYIDSLGYKMYWHLPYLYNPNNFLNNPTNIFENIISKNMLCLPSEANVAMTDFAEVKVPAMA